MGFLKTRPPFWIFGSRDEFVFRNVYHINSNIEVGRYARER